jgi:dihydrofolate synthase / folylpolyglutamate synthase
MRYVHIAGTNGKGSAAEYISNILTASGYRCGCYTSPHLISPVERIKIDGECIGEYELDELLAEVKEKKLAVNGTQFAAYTAAALLWFSGKGTDIAVMETGLGGRLDPTNSIQPDVTVLTSIDYDHMYILGNTLESIAKEKCGIIKPGVPVVSAAQHAEVKKIIAATCIEKGSSFKFVENATMVSAGLEGQIFKFEGDDYSINSIGTIQPENAALSALAAKQLGIGYESIKEGLKSTRLLCRAQFVKGNPDMILDGAHNAAAANMLKSTIEKYFPRSNKVLLFACMKDKDYKTIINNMRGIFSHVITTNVDKTRGESAEVLGKLFLPSAKCRFEEEPQKAFKLANNIAKETGALLVVCGSFYIAGFVLNNLI